MTRVHVNPRAFEPPLAPRAPTWAGLWSMTQRRLRSLGYQPGTLRVYRAALRGLARSSNETPDRIERRHLDFYLRRLAMRRRSASWLAMNLSALRTVFDKCFRAGLLTGHRGPRRPQTLPDILQVQEISRLLSACASPRDAFLLSLLYGCGLRPGEALGLRWGDFDLENREVVVSGRRVPLPEGLLALVEAGCKRCKPEDWVFTGRRPDRPLGLRSVSAIVHRLAREAGLDRPVSAMLMRHSYAAHQLQAGMTVRELQEQLGHTSIETTLRYSALEPPRVESPLDRATANYTPAPISDNGSPVTEVPPTSGPNSHTHTPTHAETLAPIRTHPHTTIPPIPIGDSEPPFPVEHPVRYFLAWLKGRLWKGPRRLRLSG